MKAELKSEPESFPLSVMQLEASSPGFPARSSVTLPLTSRFSLERAAVVARNCTWTFCRESQGKLKALSGI